MRIDETVLDDPESIAAGDPSDMLYAVGAAGAQLRDGAAAAGRAGVASLARADRPRVVVVAGMGGSGITGEILSGVAGRDCPVPVVLHRGYGLPRWVDSRDLVIGVSSSGSTEETLSAVGEAGRRGTRLLTVGAPGSPLAAACAAAHGLHVAVDPAGWQPRTCIWALSAPLLVAANALGLAHVPAEVLDSTADLLDSIATRCRPAVESVANPAKTLALELAGEIPMIWGSTDLAGVAALRFGCQVNENAKLPAVTGRLPEVSHNQVVALDGPYAAGVPAEQSDILRAGRGLSPAESPRIRLVVLRDTDEHPQLARRRAVSVQLAESRGVGVSQVLAEGTHPLERLASLVALTDHASVYLALVLGIDPTPVGPITYLKERIALTEARRTRETP